MKLKNQVKIELENFEKCSFSCDSDCGLGELYDFSCALQSFILQKIKDNEVKQDKSGSAPESPKE